MAPQPRLYISENQSVKVKEIHPKKVKKDDIPDGFELRPFICPVTGDTWAKRPDFWEHITELELTQKK